MQKKASKDNPIYSIYLVDGNTKYDLTSCLEELKFSDQKKQFSKSLTISLANIQTQGKWLVSLIACRQRVFVYANDGETSDEVWRGFVWTHGYKSSTTSRLIVLKCYDNLIYCQESEESEYFSDGKDTKDIVSTICQKWGIALEYTYSTITHSKLALRGKLSDILTTDILDLVKDRNNEKYVILSDKDVMQIKKVGQNKKIYQIVAGKNVITTEAESSMDGMITQVIILGKADDDERSPVEATVSGDTAAYGTLQKVIDRDENTSLEDAKKEGQSIIDENGKPKREYTLEAPDIPWVRKGDKIYVSAGNLIGFYIVTGVDRNITNKKKTMTLDLEDE